MDWMLLVETVVVTVTAVVLMGLLLWNPFVALGAASLVWWLGRGHRESRWF